MNKVPEVVDHPDETTDPIYRRWFRQIFDSLNSCMRQSNSINIKDVTQELDFKNLLLGFSLTLNFAI